MEENIHLHKIEIPQADSISGVRDAVHAISEGAKSVKDVADICSIMGRQARYYIQAARILGWINIEEDIPVVTSLGAELLLTEKKSKLEKTLMGKAILSSPSINSTVGSFLDNDVSLTTIATRIHQTTGLSMSTSERRARTLVAWRKYISESQEQLSLLSTPKKSDNEPSTISPSESSAAITMVTNLENETLPEESLSSTTAENDECLMDSNSASYLLRQMELGKTVLFTGAGFSFDAKDSAGKQVPLGAALCKELWEIAFPGEPFEEDSSLKDVFSVAAKKKKNDLDRLIRSRFSVDTETLPDYYELWMSAPWRKAYTLNVDDLPLAVDRKCRLQRHPKPINWHSSKNDLSPSVNIGSELPFYYLHGIAHDGVDNVTFSTEQYARRATEGDIGYVHLAADLQTYTFIFVGTPLDEQLFWQHIELRENRAGRGTRELRPKGFIVTPSLSRARQGLLNEYNIQWVKCSAEKFARDFLQNASSEYAKGLETFQREFQSTHDSVNNIFEVSTLSRNCPVKNSNFFMGDEPTWLDITEERAVVRDCDNEHFENCMERIKEYQRERTAGTPGSVPVAVITGTAGSGKSSSAMRLGLRLSTEGYGVGWIDSKTEVSPHSIIEYAESDSSFPVLLIDDADTYGHSLAGIVKDIATTTELSLIVLCLRSSKVQRLVTDPRLQELDIVTHTIPGLTDQDINAIIAALSKAHRLGKLTGLTEEERFQEFKKRADRQLLVAMIEATSGRKFDEKVADEWKELDDTGRLFYALIAVSTAFHYDIPQATLLLAAQAVSSKGDLATLQHIASTRVVAFDSGKNTYRARHRVIAEKLVEELRSNSGMLKNVIAKLAYAVAVQVSPEMKSTVKPLRFLIQILNHGPLFGLVGLEHARSVYATVEEVLNWDYHFWLQRGSLELKEGSIREAETFLNQAYGMNPADRIVETDYAYMLMKKATKEPFNSDSEKNLEEGLVTLRSLVESGKRNDPYPFHIIGIQCLAWNNKRIWEKDKRRAFLKHALQDIESGLKRNPQSQMLKDVHQEIKRAILEFALE